MYTCLANAGFLCQNPQLNHLGNLTITIGQSTGRTYYNVALACAATSLPSGLPNPSSATVLIWGNNGVASSTLSSGANTLASPLTLASGQTITVNSLPCYSTTGGRLVTASTVNIPIGTTYSGYLWMNYTMNSTAPSGTNPIQTQKIGSMILRVAS